MPPAVLCHFALYAHFGRPHATSGNQETSDCISLSHALTLSPQASKPLAQTAPHHTTTRRHTRRGQMANTVDLPVVDLRDANAVTRIREACLQHGFFFVKGHGVPDDVVSGMFRESRNYFTLPVQEKMKTLGTEANGNRGYTPMGQETLDVATQREGDTKEGYYLGREPADAEEAKIPMMVRNVWPDSNLLPEWRPTMEQYSTAMTAAGMKVVRALAEAMEVDVPHFMGHFERPVAITRLLHYAPRKSVVTSGIIGCGAHSDYGMITLLTVDQAEAGLEIHINGEWLRVPACPGAFVVNLGDMLHRWTNGTYRSTLHRVVNRTGAERYSTAFFFDPSFDTMVEVLPQFCKDVPAKYPPIRFVDHLLNMYKQTHDSYKGTQSKL
eukprot:TRINITY_DN11898_c0_g1_i1.p1 TRINITY_DN11898_c0_g1~~TRINITY_DN11898_c0_g1_i1.p1  ORF type:complete len:383 (+),score=108.21 TRINITY_DN11898_c0_g1_i1:116-1264(+)